MNKYTLSKKRKGVSICGESLGGGFGIFNLAKTITPNIAFLISKNTNILEVKHMIMICFKYTLNFI